MVQGDYAYDYGTDNRDYTTNEYGHEISSEHFKVAYVKDSLDHITQTK